MKNTSILLIISHRAKSGIMVIYECSNYCEHPLCCLRLSQQGKVELPVFFSNHIIYNSSLNWQKRTTFTVWQTFLFERQFAEIYLESI